MAMSMLVSASGYGNGWLCAEFWFEKGWPGMGSVQVMSERQVGEEGYGVRESGGMVGGEGSASGMKRHGFMQERGERRAIGKANWVWKWTIGLEQNGPKN